MMKVTGKLFPKTGQMLEEMSKASFRALGLIELGFGILLGTYLLLMT
jgi:hypothetical protein